LFNFATKKQKTMLIIIGIIVLFVLTIVLGAYKNKKNQEKKNEETVEKKVKKPTRPADCCGAHEVCEKETLLAADRNAIYYDDEELDALACTNPRDFSEEQIQMLADVFYTLNESDVAGWLRSLQMRHIQLPDDLKEEALMIVRERRETVS
jgi:uncharacterized protein HemX